MEPDSLTTALNEHNEVNKDVNLALENLKELRKTENEKYLKLLEALTDRFEKIKSLISEEGGLASVDRGAEPLSAEI